MAVTVLAILNGLAAACWLLVAAFCAIAALEGDMDYLVAALVCALVGGLHASCGYGLWKLEGFGRTIQLVFAWIGLLGIPVITIIAVLILLYLYKPGLKTLFSGRRGLTPREVQSVQAAAPMGTAVVVVLAIWLVFLVPVTGIISAIAIPNLLNAIQRGKQKRTMADVRSVGTAVESYAVDQGSYPGAEDMGGLRVLLEPTYIRQLPLTDGWHHELRYQAWGEIQGTDGASDYAIVSPGKDGKLEQTDFSWYEPGSTRRFDRDIVFGNGQFVRYPEGTQR